MDNSFNAILDHVENLLSIVTAFESMDQCENNTINQLCLSIEKRSQGEEEEEKM